ncbi:hypothetical protein A4U49_13610 [Acidithiobacillus ferrivorans]|uniref:hypothetical protein n=1 Tax=Acidithiobacillus ferrivorans TaxID=160808 RepID=UPI00089333A6|nr:hypothetical protein [Acidithiobacillus ferrivorans]OFA15312.1 hypothetical protein A4U49_13610 [Acidithiobacillus ferrivorans]
MNWKESCTQWWHDTRFQAGEQCAWAMQWEELEPFGGIIERVMQESQINPVPTSLQVALTHSQHWYRFLVYAPLAVSLPLMARAYPGNMNVSQTLTHEERSVLMERGRLCQWVLNYFQNNTPQPGGGAGMAR